MKTNKKTNATKSEIKKIQKLYLKVQRTPCFAITSEQALSGRDFASIAYERLYSLIKKLALKHGYPKRKRRYGIDCETGEFI